jgi:hypothetical protein
VSDFGIVLPSSESISAFWRPAEHSVALPPGFQLCIRKPGEAVNVCLVLLSSIIECGAPHPNGKLSSKSSDTSLWILDCSNRIMDWCDSLGRIHSPDRRQVIASLSSISYPLLCSILSHSSLLIFVDLIARMLRSVSPLDGDIPQMQISKCLFLLLEIDKRNRELNLIHKDRFVRGLVNAVQRPEELSKLNVELQVSYEAVLWSSFSNSFQSALTSCLNRAKPYLSLLGQGTIDFPEIESPAQISESGVWNTFRALSITPKVDLEDNQSDQEHQAKRQRLQANPDSHTEQYNKLISQLSEIFPGEPQTTLCGLQVGVM